MHIRNMSTCDQGVGFRIQLCQSLFPCPSFGTEEECGDINSVSTYTALTLYQTWLEPLLRKTPTRALSETPVSVRFLRNMAFPEGNK